MMSTGCLTDYLKVYVGYLFLQDSARAQRYLNICVYVYMDICVNLRDTRVCNRAVGDGRCYMKRVRARQPCISSPAGGRTSTRE